MASRTEDPAMNADEVAATCSPMAETLDEGHQISDLHLTVRVNTGTPLAAWTKGDRNERAV